jgi:FAD/FMN-containing dehydrogenase
MSDTRVSGEAAWRPAIARFAGVRPQEHVRCRTPADVAGAIALARAGGLPLAVRGGGHCFAGRSSTEGVLVDVGPMDDVTPGDGRVTVGAGARLGAIYDELARHGRTIAAGCGPAVGVAGLALGGGLGILGRTHGLTCDQVLAARVVLADGRVVDCDEDREPELFWALRGAGGGQFGVVTRFVLRTVPAPPATTLHLRWPFADAAALLAAWQAWAPDAPDPMAASLLVTAGADPRAEPVAHVFGALLGGRSQASALLDGLVARAGADPARAELHELPYRRAKAHLAMHGPGEEAGPDALGYSKSEYFRRPLPAEAIGALLEHVAASRRPGELRVLDLSPWGGAYNRVPEDATAFAHRGERFVVKHDVVIGAGAGADRVRAARAWLARSWELIHPWGAGRVYPNFPDPELDGALAAYHAGNLDRLVRVKAAYDPGDVFRFPQSVPTSRA